MSEDVLGNFDGQIISNWSTWTSASCSEKELNLGRHHEMSQIPRQTLTKLHLYTFI
jgi:hypothetical protein